MSFDVATTVPPPTGKCQTSMEKRLAEPLMGYDYRTPKTKDQVSK